MNSLEIVKLIIVLLLLLPPVVLSRGNHVGIYEHHRHPTLRPQTLKMGLRRFSGRLVAVFVRKPHEGNQFKQR